MVDQEVLKEHWNELKSRISAKWETLTSEDLASFTGNVDQFVRLVERKTGETRLAIEKVLESLTPIIAQSLTEVADSAGVATSKLATEVREKTREANQVIRDGYRTMDRNIRQSPGPSVAIFAGAGICAGVLLALFLRR